jgi:pSer/pThr/pTyr-binding forkhead associated (FHA) protein
MKSAEEPSVVPLGLTSTRFAFHNLGSNNGTMVNGRRIGTQESILLHDDTVSIDPIDVPDRSESVSPSPVGNLLRMHRRAPQGKHLPTAD